MKGLRIVVISGPVGAGKSTVAEGLARTYGAIHLSTKELLREMAVTRGVELLSERAAMQRFGTQLDTETDGHWVADAVSRKVSGASDLQVSDVGLTSLFIVDAVRIKKQIDELRAAFGGNVVHLHLYSSQDVLAHRYAERGDTSGLQELSSYDEVAADPTEAGVRDLASDADVAIDTERSNIRDVLIRAAAALQLLPRADDRLVDVLVGGQYGSEGKGNLAFYLAREYDVLMRVGGPNAGHKVPLPTAYTHRLLPSGTQANAEAQLVIGPGATLDIEVLLREISDCSVEASRLSIDPQAMIIEQADKDLEQSLVADIGSTGKGGGAAAARRILGRSDKAVTTPVRLAKDAIELRAYIRSSQEVLDENFRNGRRVLLEGTQGTALSLYHGFYPHVTSRDTTTPGTLAESGIGPRRLRRVILVARTYPIRVQDPDNEGKTSGPMSQEISYEELARRSGVPLEELVRTEKGSVSNRQRRLAEFDWALLRSSVELNGATDLALTFADYLDVQNREAQRYDQLTDRTIQFVEEVERVSGVPVSLMTTRFDVRSVIDRRRW
ncbi:adenylosuccinate synthetase [Kribbella sp. CA-293567]|uniref:adenylosuccinate synthetase n=1 Tax=Kribbella sp. CA-293567 TaxID=3002436 RepID=UPI0022DD27DB|nr:adenylosuccinate synthetase [Kribbella sp. CA-293567]WBQ04454.1 adenylosuccinate synthetase [Kribbella sp. CA-293567]